MKKILKTFLIVISSLLGVTSLSACDFFKKSEDVSNQIVIDAASFEYTYTTISFDFKKDTNAIYYSVFFTGQENYTMQKVEPNSTYQIPEISDGKYKLFLKAIASINYADSNLFYLGEMNKEKPEKSVENLKITANINEKYGINITTSCVSAKNEQLKFEISGDNVRAFELEAKVNTTVKTEDNLPAGNYSISAWFVETPDYKASQKISYNGTLSIGKRKLSLQNFSANYNKGSVSLYWDQDKSIDCGRKLMITHNGITNEYLNDYKGLSIQSGLNIGASEYGVGDISFSLQLISKDSTTYFDSDINESSTTISKYAVSSAPNLTVDFDNNTGSVTVDSPHYFVGKYQLSVSCQSGNRLDGEPEYFIYDEETTYFPVVFELANENWGKGTYAFSLKRKAENSLEIDSEITTVTKNIGQLTVSPAVTFSYQQNDQDVYTKITITTSTPSWANQPWVTNECVYALRLSVFLSQTLTIQYINFSQKSFEFELPNSLPRNLYCVSVSVNNVNVGYGYRFESVESRLMEVGSGTLEPSSDNLIRSFSAKIQNNGATTLGSRKFKISFWSNFPYSNLSLYVTCSALDINEELHYISVSEKANSYQMITEEVSVYVGIRTHGTFTFTFTLKSKFLGVSQTLSCTETAAV